MKYFIKKTITLILTLLVVTFVTFIAFEVIPGDSADLALGIDATKEQVEAYREQMGLNDPVIVRYGSYLTGVLSGDFGESTSYHVGVSTLLKERLPVTISLAILSIIMIVVISFPLGIFVAKKERSKFDGFLQFVIQLGMAIPPFFLGMLLTLLFGLILKWFTPGAFVSIEENFVGFVSYLIFPAIAIAIPKIAMLVKFLQSSIRRQLSLDYVRTAKSKGSSKQRILYGHVLKNALIPVITFLAMIIAEVFAGSIIIEQVFNLPGLGRLLIVSISARDFAVVQAIVLYIATIVLLLNFIVDVMYQYIDPRVRVQ